jgi:hypothetical protein
MMPEVGGGGVAQISLLLARVLSGVFDLGPGMQGLAADDLDFRTWFWENRPLDLAIQAVLIFAAALGILALLPQEREDKP